MKLFWTALLVGIAAITGHVFSLEYKKNIAYQMAPQEPAAREISDEEAIKILKNGEYGYLYDDAPSQRALELTKASLRFGESVDFYEKNVKPIEEKVELRVNLSFAAVYLFVASLLGIAARSWFRKSGPEGLAKSVKGAALTVANLVGSPFKGLFAKSQVRSAEAEFISMKNLYDSGLITEEDFNAKKQELQAKIQKNL